jgi:hypothetical protein
MFRVRHLITAGVLLTIPCLATVAHAQESTAGPTDSVTAPPGWTTTIRPYLFLAGISGSLTAGPSTIPINSSFGELVDNLQPSFFTAVAFEKGVWGVYADFQYISLEGEGTGMLGTTVGLKNIIGEADVTFRPSPGSSLRLLAGARGYQVDQSVTINSNPPIHGETFVIDPIIGAMGTWDLGDKWQFEMRGDFGGFGISSEFTSQLSIVAMYDVSSTISIPFGYRILNYRIKDDEVWMDTSMGGLVLGVDIRP